MASCKTQEPRRKNKEGVINNLRELFDNVLHVDIIRSVATQCNYDVQRSTLILLEMTNNINGPSTKKKSKPKKSTPNVTPKKSEPRPQPPNVVVNKSKKSLDLDRVVKSIRDGYKVLVLLRGPPGSGKSRLAATITEASLGPGSHDLLVLSTDDFFVGQRRGYVFEPQKLQEAHEWNHRRAFQAMSRGLSPVIIDNTNTQMWEMKPYAMMATDYGYIVEILEPDTWWSFNEKELAKKNIHGVPRNKIKDILDRYEKNVTPQKLLSAYNLVYKFQKPPQFRLFPPIIQNSFANVRPVNGYAAPCHRPNLIEGVAKSKSTSALNRQNSSEIDQAIENINLMDFTDDISPLQTGTHEGNFNTLNPVDEILMCTEEGPVNILQPNQINETSSKNESKLFSEIENAWGVNVKALQSWDVVTPLNCNTDNSLLPLAASGPEDTKPEMKDNSSNVENIDFWRGDSEGCKIVDARGRDINSGSPIKTFTVPKKTMVDQSCTTEDLARGDQNRIKDLMDLFPRIPRSSLVELFNKCDRNFHWTVDLLLEDNHLEISEQKEEEEEEPIEIDDSDDDHDDDEPDQKQEEMKNVNVPKRKIISESSSELKKCILEKIDIGKEHYSEHVLKVKHSKFGGYQEPSTSSVVVYSDSDSESDESIDENPKDMIELNLGDTLVSQLETLFGGDFPQGYQPVVEIPTSLARQIYSFYIESVCQQMETQNSILDRLVKEDEEFARQLQSLEEEILPETPNLPEIMDEQVALGLHHRDVNEWKNMTADNLAVRLTKQKLFAAFPNVEKTSLLEIWHAYDYDYKKTVEDLIASVGPADVNGPRETISDPPLSKAALQEMKEAEESCVELEELGEQPATYYRDVANRHLINRQQLYEKAKIYYQRGMAEVATFYSELAKKETQFYDRANHIAASAFIDEHSKRLQKFDTLDLHYFYVKEAIPNLDIFIDRNINLLKGSKKKSQDLYIITGRGKHSEGGRSKIKPAVITRLKKRKISFVQLNPGLLKIKVMCNSPMTSDLP